MADLKAASWISTAKVLVLDERIGDFALVDNAEGTTGVKRGCSEITFRPKLLCLPGSQLLGTGATRPYAGL